MTHQTPSGRVAARRMAPAGRVASAGALVAPVALLAFALILAVVLVGGKAPLPVDEAALSLALSVRSAALTTVMLQVTSIAMPAVLVVVALALVALGQGPRPFLAAAVNVAGAAGLNWAVKHLVMRPRPPEELRLAVEGGWSFPSGHTVTAVAFYGLLAWLVWRSQRAGAWRTAQLVLLALAVALVGISRVYLAVHYLTDVLAGLCLAIAWLALFTRHAAPRILAPPPAGGAD